jgi:hypothetical protein
MKECKHCGSDNLEWKIEAFTNSQVSNGRYNNHDFFVQMYQGCTDCGETLEIIQHIETYESPEIQEALAALGETLLNA